MWSQNCMKVKTGLLSHSTQHNNILTTAQKWTPHKIRFGPVSLSTLLTLLNKNTDFRSDNCRWDNPLCSIFCLKKQTKSLTFWFSVSLSLSFPFLFPLYIYIYFYHFLHIIKFAISFTIPTISLFNFISSFSSHGYRRWCSQTEFTRSGCWWVTCACCGW
jgi:hypothetical protein